MEKCLFTLTLSVIIFSRPNYVITQLNSSSVAEGPCMDPPLAPLINPFWFLARRIYFIPLASQYSFRNYAEAFLGRPPNSTSEMERMCLKVYVSGLTARTYGFNRVIYQSCSLTRRIFTTLNPGQIQCSVDHASSGTRTALLGNYTDNVVMTDNRSYALYVRCINGTRDYKLTSTLPDIPEGLFAQVRARIINLGFNPDLIQRLSCNGQLGDISNDININ